VTGGKLRKVSLTPINFQSRNVTYEGKTNLKTADGKSFGEVISIDPDTGLVSIKKGPSIKEIHPDSVFTDSMIPDDVKENAILRIADWVANNGIDEPRIISGRKRFIDWIKSPVCRNLFYSKEIRRMPLWNG
jgi:hypothetical protein